MPETLTACLRAPNGHAMPIPSRRVAVGESPACDLPIARGYGLAGVHFRLQPWEQGHFLEDAGSGLGVLVNGQATSWAPLKHGDRITAGELTLIYETSAEPVPAFPSAAEELEAPPPQSPPPAAQPPSWLPPEALLPPAPPPAWNPPAPRASRRPLIIAMVFLLLALLCAAVWLFMR